MKLIIALALVACVAAVPLPVDVDIDPCVDGGVLIDPIEYDPCVPAPVENCIPSTGFVIPNGCRTGFRRPLSCGSGGFRRSFPSCGSSSFGRSSGCGGFRRGAGSFRC